MLTNENVFAERVLVSATKIYRKKLAGCVAHAGLLLSFSNGEKLVLHRNPYHNAHLSTIDEFSAGEVIKAKETYKVTNLMIKRINHCLYTNSKYSVFNNCEHLVSEILTGKATSEQLKSAVYSSFIGTILFAYLSGNRNVNTLATAAVGFGIAGLCIEKSNMLS